MLRALAACGVCALLISGLRDRLPGQLRAAGVQPLREHALGYETIIAECLGEGLSVPHQWTRSPTRTLPPEPEQWDKAVHRTLCHAR